MAAPIGNQNAAKSRQFEQALTRAITQDDGKRVRAAAEKLLDLAAEGEAWAIKELRDTLDGKPAQSVQLSGDPDNPVSVMDVTNMSDADLAAIAMRGIKTKK